MILGSNSPRNPSSSYPKFQHILPFLVKKATQLLEITKCFASNFCWINRIYLSGSIRLTRLKLEQNIYIIRAISLKVFRVDRILEGAVGFQGTRIMLTLGHTFEDIPPDIVTQC